MHILLVQKTLHYLILILHPEYIRKAILLLMGMFKLKNIHIFVMIFQKHLLKYFEIHALNPLEVEMSFMQISCIILNVNH